MQTFDVELPTTPRGHTSFFANSSGALSAEGGIARAHAYPEQFAAGVTFLRDLGLLGCAANLKAIDQYARIWFTPDEAADLHGLLREFTSDYFTQTHFDQLVSMTDYYIERVCLTSEHDVRFYLTVGLLEMFNQPADNDLSLSASSEQHHKTSRLSIKVPCELHADGFYSVRTPSPGL